MKLDMKSKVKAQRKGVGSDQKEDDGQGDCGRHDHQAQYSSTPLLT